MSAAARRQAPRKVESSSMSSVSLVIAARDAHARLPAVLAAVAPLVGHDGLTEVVVVDDASRDATSDVARDHGARVVVGEGRGAAAARNRGWRAAAGESIWFLDDDCVPQPSALAQLVAHLEEPHVAGVGGAIRGREGAPWLARLVAAEVTARQQAMRPPVSHLASGNVLYRRAVLEAVGGFDEQFRWAHDADLSYRVRQAGWELRFAPESRVSHAYASRLGAYLYKQAQQGYWRVALYRRHRGRMAGDNYSGVVDHVQPPLAVVGLVSLILSAWPSGRLFALATWALLAALQVPMTWQLARQERQLGYLAFAPLSLIRAVARGIGMTWGLVALWRRPVDRGPGVRTSGGSAAECDHASTS